MAGEWTLVEYRPGRYAKVTASGEFLGMATEAETREWFEGQGPQKPLVKAPHRCPELRLGTRDRTPSVTDPATAARETVAQLKAQLGLDMPVAESKPAEPPQEPKTQAEPDTEASIGEPEVSPRPEGSIPRNQAGAKPFSEAAPSTELQDPRPEAVPEAPARGPEPEIEVKLKREPETGTPDNGARAADKPPATMPAWGPTPRVRSGAVDDELPIGLPEQEVVREAKRESPTPEPEPEPADTETIVIGASSERDTEPELELEDDLLDNDEFRPDDELSGEDELEIEAELGTSGAMASRTEPDARAAEAPAVPSAAASDAADRWLWLDPGYAHQSGLAGSELAAFLQQAVELFQAKDWTGGRKPGRLVVHPDQLTDGMKPVAEALGLDVVSDPRVTRGTFRLGLSEKRKKATP
jgi:hypothetical protein